MRGRPEKKPIDYAELKRQWLETKPRILKHLNDGWSKAVAFKKAGLLEHSDLYHICYTPDKEFRNSISKFNQWARGFYG